MNNNDILNIKESKESLEAYNTYWIKKEKVSQNQINNENISNINTNPL